MAIRIALLAAFCLATTAHAQTAPMQSRRFGSRSYVAAADIARYYGTDSAQLAVRSEQRSIRVNSVTHWLTAPVLSVRGQLWIATTDVRKTIAPVLRPRRSPTVRTVVLDPGHGGTDRGTRGRSSREKDLTLDVAKRVQNDLADSGVRVLLTRTSDRTVSLEDRTDFARSKRADVFVSIHFNSGGSASGIETYCVPSAGEASTASSWFSRGDSASSGNRFDENSVWLAHCLQSTLLRGTAADDRGVRRARFQVLRDASCPAILVEAGFLSNVAEERRILTVEYRERLAKAIADGILKYKRSAE